MKHTLWLTYSSILLILAACGPAGESTRAVESVSTVNVASPGAQGYPAPSESDGEGGYPSPADESQGSEQAYPAPATDGADSAYPPPKPVVNEAKRFTLDEPVRVGQTAVSGTGPANIPIKLISVSHAGEELAFGATDAGGNFSFDLVRPAEENEILGVSLGNESMRDDFLDAPGTDIPLIGLVLVQTIVEP